jgi:hypothetical protein
MNNNIYSEYPYAYASGIYKGRLSSLWTYDSIPGIEIKDWKAFKAYIENEVAKCDADIEKFRNNRSV